MNCGNKEESPQERGEKNRFCFCSESHLSPDQGQLFKKRQMTVELNRVLPATHEGPGLRTQAACCTQNDNDVKNSRVFGRGIGPVTTV